MFADDLLAAVRRLDPKRAASIEQELRKAIVVKIQNVVDYFWETTGQEIFDFSEDFPNVAPPWPRAWMEWRMPAGMRIGSVYRKAPPMDDLGHRPQYGAMVAGEKLTNNPLGATWKLQIMVFQERVMPLDPFIGAVDLRVDGDGRIVRSPGNPSPDPLLVHAIPDELIRLAGGDTGALIGMLDTLAIFPILLALSLCHCKNVTLAPEEFSPALQKRRQGRGKAPITKFYTLEIAAMRKTLESAAAGNLKQALHICRGHFKDYREGAGLFGRVHGMYWWDMQARGDARRGEIRKDYAVDAPLPPPPPTTE